MDDYRGNSPFRGYRAMGETLCEKISKTPLKFS